MGADLFQQLLGRIAALEDQVRHLEGALLVLHQEPVTLPGPVAEPRRPTVDEPGDDWQDVTAWSER
jgi:hypothetical protein